MNSIFTMDELQFYNNGFKTFKVLHLFSLVSQLYSLYSYTRVNALTEKHNISRITEVRSGNCAI